MGLPDAEQLKIMSGLVIEITRAVRRLGLTQSEAGRRMGISQAKVSGLMGGDFPNLSERKLTVALAHRTRRSCCCAGTARMIRRSVLTINALQCAYDVLIANIYARAKA